MSKAKKEKDEQDSIYIVSVSAYEDDEPTIFKFVGTFRNLLIFLLNEDAEDLGQMSDHGLIAEFNSANGDGQPYYQVYSLTKDRVILG